MVTLTPRAAEKALDLARRGGKPPRLRVGVRGGGCSGLSYFYDFDTGQRADDQEADFFGLQVVCDPKSLSFLTNTVLDFDPHPLRGGFRFSNPQAKRSCSCGESFTV